MLFLSGIYSHILLNIFIDVGLDLCMVFWPYFLSRSFSIGSRGWSGRVHVIKWENCVGEDHISTGNMPYLTTFGLSKVQN